MARSWPYLNAILAHLGLQDASKSRQGASKTPSRPSKTPPRASKTSKTPPAGDPRTSQIGVSLTGLAVQSYLDPTRPPKRLKEPPGRLRDAFKSLQDPSKSFQDGPTSLQDAPKSLQDAPQDLPRWVQDTPRERPISQKSDAQQFLRFPGPFWGHLSFTWL